MKCIKKTSLCDGIFDCGNKADEKVDSCDECNGFICRFTHVCITNLMVCDNKYDCLDNGALLDYSDEEECKCPEFKCGHGKCYTRQEFCDGEFDCEYSKFEEHYCSEADLFPKYCKKFKYSDPQIQYILNNVRLSLIRTLEGFITLEGEIEKVSIEEFRLSKAIPFTLQRHISIDDSRNYCQNPNWEELYRNSKYLFLHLTKFTFTIINTTVLLLNFCGLAFGVFGNMFIILYCLEECKKKNFNFLIIGNLAFIDLIMCVFRMSFRVIESFWGNYIYGKTEFLNFYNLLPNFFYICYYVTALRTINLCTSQWNLVGVAVERWIMVKFPHKMKTILCLRNRICFLVILNFTSLGLAVWFSLQSAWEFVSTIYSYAIHDFNLHCTYGFFKSYEIDEFLIDNSWYDSLIFNNINNLANRVLEIFCFIIFPVSMQSLLYTLVMYSSLKIKIKTPIMRACIRFSLVCLMSNFLYLLFTMPLIYHKIRLIQEYWLRDIYMSKSANHEILPWSTDEKYNKLGLFDLSQFDKYVFRTSEDFYFVMSAINPWIYILLSSKIRSRVKMLFCM